MEYRNNARDLLKHKYGNHMGYEVLNTAFQAFSPRRGVVGGGEGAAAIHCLESWTNRLSFATHHRSTFSALSRSSRRHQMSTSPPLF